MENTARNNRNVDGGSNNSRSDVRDNVTNIASSTQASTSSPQKDSANDFDSELNVALQGMVKKTERPMNQFHHRVYKYMVDIDQQIDRLSTENVMLKEEKEKLSIFYEGKLKERDQEIADLKRDLDACKTQRDQSKMALEKSKMDTDDKQTTVVTLKRDRDKLRSELAEIATTMTNKDVKLKELEIKLNKLRKNYEDQTHELKMCETSKRQMGEKIASLERGVRDGEAYSAELTSQLNSLKRDKTHLDIKLETQMEENTRISSEQDDLRKKLSVLDTKVQEYEETVDKIVAEEVAFRTTPSLMNQLISERQAEIKSSSSGVDDMRPTLNMPMPQPEVERNMDGPQRKRKSEAVHGKSTGGAGKKIKGGSCRQKDDDTEEEGEIIEQQPQQEPCPGTSVLRSMTAPASGARSASLQKSGNRYREAKSIPVVSNYRSYSRYDSSAGVGRGKR